MSPAGARVELGEQPGDGGLARAGLADQGGHPAAAQREVDVVDRVHRRRAVAAKQVAQLPADGEVLGQADRPRAPPRWPAPSASRLNVMPSSCRRGADGRGAAPGGRSRPGRGVRDQEVAGLRCRTTSSALGWVGCAGGVRVGVVGPADPVLRAVRAADVVRADAGSSASARRRSSGACSARRCGRRRRSALAYAFSAAVASGLLKRPKLPAGRAVPIGLSSVAVHDGLVDVVRRRAAVGPAQRGVEVALVDVLEPGVLVRPCRPWR